MLDSEKARLIRRLLAEGKLTQHEIAEQVGVSRVTVGRVSSRQRTHDEEWESDLAVLEPTGPAQRCPGCGGFVFMPCVLCRVRHAQQRKRAARHARSSSAA